MKARNIVGVMVCAVLASASTMWAQAMPNDGFSGGFSDDATADLFEAGMGAWPADRRFGPTTRPDVPTAQKPPMATTQNVDTGKPVWNWQRATDDWGGLRPQLDDKGITLQSSLTIEYAKNLRGGASTNGEDFRNLFNFNLTLDTDRLMGWKGGTFFFNAQNENSSGSSDPGDLQSTTNIEGDEKFKLSEGWFEQVLFEDKVKIKGGKIDVNSDFSMMEFGGEFINASFGASPTIAGFPTFPDTAFGIQAAIEPVEWFYAAGGVFDGATQDGTPTGTRGPSTLFGSPSDLFFIAEAGLKWEAEGKRNGRLAFGGYHHTGTFDEFTGGTDDGTQGAYAIFDQVLYRPSSEKEDDGRGLGLSFYGGFADQSVNEVRDHVAAVLSYTGLISGRDEDVLGLGITYVNISDGAGGGNETTVELFYKAQLTPFLSVKPDLQYIRNPSGRKDIEDALVATIRVVIDF